MAVSTRPERGGGGQTGGPADRQPARTQPSHARKPSRAPDPKRVLAQEQLVRNNFPASRLPAPPNAGATHEGPPRPCADLPCLWRARERDQTGRQEVPGPDSNPHAPWSRSGPHTFRGETINPTARPQTHVGDGPTGRAEGRGERARADASGSCEPCTPDGVNESGRGIYIV